MPLKVNGHQIQNRIKLARLEADNAYKNFCKHVLQFESEAERPNLDALHKKYLTAENKVASLATLQDLFNITTKVVVLGKEVTLAEALNNINAAGRAAKLWRIASNATVEVSRWNRTVSAASVREKDKEYAVRAMSEDECLKRIYVAEERASAYRAAFSSGNDKTIDAGEAAEFFSSPT